MTDLERAMRHIKTRADAWAVKEIEKALSQEPCDECRNKRTSFCGNCKDYDEFEQEPCDDAISREAVISETIRKNSIWNSITNSEGKNLEEIIFDLPSVTQSRRKGQWINDKYDMPTCSECGYIPQYDRAIDDYEYSNYCPSCGARMVEPQESEDKE